MGKGVLTWFGVAEWGTLVVVLDDGGDAPTGALAVPNNNKNNNVMRGDTATQTVGDVLMLRSGASWGKPVCGCGCGGN